MKPSILNKLENLSERYAEIAILLSENEVISDQNQFRQLSMEYSQLEPVVKEHEQYLQAAEDKATALEMLDDPEMKELAQDELRQANANLESLESTLQVLLLPKDPNDDSNIFLEVRAGTGGDEAAIFAGDLFRMYSRYAEVRGWQVEIMSQNIGEHGGYKEAILRIIGKGAYSRLKFESGAHRVQRVPETESQGRVHTSTITVAIMPEADEVEFELNMNDVRIDVYRSGGKGGQSVNTTDSAVRVVHNPTNTVVAIQDEKSQLKNKEKALKILRSRIFDKMVQEAHDIEAAERKGLVGKGDRSERIRTYNFPQGRLSDHRIGLTLYSLEKIIEGDLAPVTDALIAHNQAALLKGQEE